MPKKKRYTAYFHESENTCYFEEFPKYLCETLRKTCLQASIFKVSLVTYDDNIWF